MARISIIIAIALCYFIFAILLNSVGTVILQSITSFDITKTQASVLEGFKDLPIAIVSFLVASFIPRVGYKLALLMGLILVTAMCLITPSIGNFLVIKLLFASVGVAFALVKVSVYAIVGQLSEDTRQHSSLLNLIEGIFMLGVLSGYWIFSWFIDSGDPAALSWMNVYYVLAAMLLVIAVVVMFAPIAPAEHKSQNSLLDDFLEMLRLAIQPLVLIFILSVFLYVLIEQGVGTWLPTFNNKVLELPVSVSVQITSIFALSLAVGRLTAGAILTRVNWFPFLLVCLAAMSALIILALPLATQGVGAAATDIFDAPLAAYLIPLVGLFMAPIYPIINSVVLSALEKSKQAAMTGLIVVFSALGGTTGSIITGAIFDTWGGIQAFYMVLIPIVGIAITLYLFKNNVVKLNPQHVG